MVKIKNPIEVYIHLLLKPWFFGSPINTAGGRTIPNIRSNGISGFISCVHLSKADKKQK